MHNSGVNLSKTVCELHAWYTLNTLFCHLSNSGVSYTGIMRALRSISVIGFDRSSKHD